MQDNGLFKPYCKYLTGPIVQPFVGRWDMPESLLDLIPIARMLQILKDEANDDEQGLASEEEALSHLCDLMLEALCHPSGRISTSGSVSESVTLMCCSNF